jgi:hypothetical protein
VNATGRLPDSRYEDAEKRTAAAMEQSVKRESFGELLARITENALAVLHIGNDAADLVVRNLRLAGRRDIINPQSPARPH